MQLPLHVPLLLFSYCLAATAGVPWRQHRAAGGGDSPCPRSAGPFPGLGPGPWGLGLETAVPAKQLKPRPGEVLAAGRYFGPGRPPRNLGGRDPCSISGPSPSSLFLLPYLRRGVGTETTLGVMRRLRKQPQWGLAPQLFPSFLEAAGTSYYPLGFDLRSSKLLGEQEPRCQTLRSVTVLSP